MWLHNKATSQYKTHLITEGSCKLRALLDGRVGRLTAFEDIILYTLLTAYMVSGTASIGLDAPAIFYYSKGHHRG
jgi:nitrate reductase gamma subunit